MDLKVAIIAISISAIAFNSFIKEPEKGIPNEVLIAFSKWKSSHQRLYSTPNEQSHRLRTFHKNYNLIKEINSANLSYTFTLNKFADMSKEEFAAKYLSEPVVNQEISLPISKEEDPKHKEEQQPPQGWDWSQHGCKTFIYDQGNKCNAGYAIAAVNALTYGWHNDKGGESIQQSPQEIIDCAFEKTTYGCSGGDIIGVFLYSLNKGLSTEKEYPYEGRATGKCSRTAPSQYKLESVRSMGHGNSDAIVKALRKKPVAVSVDASTWQFYKEGIFDGNGCSPSFVNHYVVLVGYGTSQSIPFWKLENSWGSNWGEEGYMRIQRASGMGNYPCGIPALGIYPIFW